MTISETSKEVDLSADTLRYYEKIGILGPVQKNSAGHRDYQEEDVQRINFIKCMRTAGLSIELIKKYLYLYELGDETTPQRKEILVSQREELANKMKELQNTLDYLDAKIEKYNQN